MRILVVSQWFPPEAGGGPARFIEMARVWQDRGHEVTVLAGIPNWPKGRIHDDYRRRFLVRETYGGVPVIRTPVIPARNEGVVRRLANHGSFVLSSSLVGLARWRPDVVVATSPPMFAPLTGLARARRYRVPFVLDVRDLWPDAIFTLADLRPKVARKGLERFERFLYRSADAVVVVTEGFAETVRQRGARRVETIPNGVDLDTFKPGPRDPDIRRQLAGDEGFVVLYGGTLGLAHGLDATIGAAERLGDSGVRFVFVGEGADRPALEALVARKGLTNVSFLPTQPRERMPALYRAADLCLVSLRRAELFAVTIPSKIFEIMGTARPVLAAIEGEAADIIRAAGAGFVVEPGSIDALVDGIAKARASEQLDEMGIAGRRFVEKRYDRTSLALRFERLLEDVTGGRTSAA